MKRDLDLCRQLLFDLETHGPDCAVNVLNAGPANEADERVRYHLRLLIDAGFVKEIDRTAGGIACVRLTNSGIEMLELCRSDVRWRDAQRVVLDQTGGLSLTVLRTVLTKWAVEASTQPYGDYRRRRAYRPYYRRVEPRSRYDVYRYDRDHLYDDDIRLVRNAPDYRERFDWRGQVVDGEYNGYVADPIDAEVGVSLPVYLV